MKVSCRVDRGRKKGYIHLCIYAVVCCQLIYVVCIFTLFLYITYVLYLLSPVWHGEIDGRQKLILRILIMKIQNLKLHTSVYKQTWNHPLIITTNLAQQTRAEKLFIGTEKNKQN